MSANQKISKDELKKIRSLTDFDLIMLLSDIHDHGWPVASATLEMAYETSEAEKGNPHDFDAASERMKKKMLHLVKKTAAGEVHH